MNELFETARQFQEFCDRPPKPVRMFRSTWPQPCTAIPPMMRERHALSTPSGTGVDVSLAAFPFEELIIGPASAFAYGAGIELRTCSAEDLVVMKLFASRPGDVRDVQG